MDTLDKTIQAFIPNVKVVSLLNRLCSDLDKTIRDGDKAQLAHHITNIDGMSNFIALMLDAFFSHLMDRFCHCEIDCANAYGAGNIS